MKIIKTGKSYEFDKDDYLIADNSSLEVRGKWLTALNDFVKIYNKDYVHSIYIRGSVAINEAIDNISDLDFIVVYRDKRYIEQLDSDEVSEAYIKYNNEVRDLLLMKHQFIFNVGIEKTEPKLSGYNHLTIKHLSTCIYGDNLQPGLPKVTKQELKDMTIDYKRFAWEFNDMLAGRISQRYISRVLLRITFMLVFKIHKDDIWTRDLYQCYTHSKEVYPEQEKYIHFILEIAIRGWMIKRGEHANTILINYESWLYNELLTHKIITDDQAKDIISNLQR